MEACGSAHHWARRLNALGHRGAAAAGALRSRLRQTQQDRCGRCRAPCSKQRAAPRSSRCGSSRSSSRRCRACIARARCGWRTRTSRINALRGFCREFGIVIAQGARLGLEQIARVLADPHSRYPTLLRAHAAAAASKRSACSKCASRSSRRELSAARAAVLSLHRRCCRSPASACSPPPRMVAATGGTRQSLQERAPLRRLVRPYTQGAFLRRPRVISAASPNAAIATCACCSPMAHARCCGPPRVARSAGRPLDRCASGRSDCPGAHQPQQGDLRACQQTRPHLLCRRCVITNRYDRARLTHKDRPRKPSPCLLDRPEHSTTACMRD